MSHIFISYSHNDIAQAKALHHALEGADYNVWRDTCIKRNWRDEIIIALNNANAVVVLLSSESVCRDYVRKEVAYALDHKIPIFPLALNNFTYDREINTADDWFEFHIESIQLNDSIEKILNLLSEENIPRNHRVYQMVQPEKVYSVGDFYDEEGIQGIVFEISDSGTHGKIISLNEDVEIHWTDIYRCYCTRDEKIQEKIEKRIGATSFNDGQDNSRKFIDEYAQDLIPKNLLPALSCCVNMQGGWYLPAIGELISLLNHTTRTIINQTLHKHNADELMPNTIYWSSTEDNYGYLKSFELDKHGRVTKGELNKFGGVANIRYIRKF